MMRALAAILLTAAFVTGLTRLMPGDWCGEFFPFRAAAELIVSGQSPYRPELELPVQERLRGGKVARVVPYFYLPWFALGCSPLLLLAPAAGRVAWGFLGSLELTVAAWLLAGVAPNRSRPATMALGVSFPFSLLAIWIGQPAPLILMMAVVAWRLAEAGRDAAAGAVLAAATFKPQLVVVVISALLLNALRRGRWGGPIGFAATIAVLGLLSAAFVPDWPREVLAAVRDIPVPTRSRPEIGVTWWTVLRAAGLGGVPLALTCATATLPVLAQVVRLAWRPDRPTAELLAWSFVATFFAVPYAQIYDFPVLLPAILVVLGRLTPVAATLALAALILGSYAHMIGLTMWAQGGGPPPATLFWIPVVLAIGLARGGRPRTVTA